MSAAQSDSTAPGVTLWLDPVCPFTWNTARWLRSAAEKHGLAVDWRLMNLAVLNEGREMSPAHQDRMRASQQLGRLMAAIAREHGSAGFTAAYFAFGERYFDRSQPLTDSLIADVLSAANLRDVAPAAVSDAALDDIVRSAHQEGQDALGETGGSPILRIGEHTFFGPVLTGLPDADAAVALFDALAALAAIPQFTQLQRPRTEA
ncbi:MULTISPECIES: DsbA family protein [Mycobacterium]|uniref:Uncharacterized protein n=1 Tax=Mycobacterium colombiense TaxID=339268 RepID=A0A329M3Y0_9MYCO|nr:MULTISPECIES: DsbA family protein [Mycobacterium]MDM4141759.1 DsbA family protein [Mycobacterium sp. FLAC0960]RAV14731.1 hypothetical protein DQP57_05580 [Mycobacterium colombiense]